jgi:4'-phosphopantetheinyl transferase
LVENLNKFDLRFNLAHSEDLMLLAITCGREIGVDLELLRPLKEAETIAKQFFSASEYAKLCALPPDEKAKGFFNCWTRKEAYLKAQGSGTAYPLNQFEVSLEPGEPPALLNVTTAPNEAARWSLQELTPVEGYLAALAVEGHNWYLTCWDFSFD